MAVTSGFFQAVWDENLPDPTTGEYTGYWDRNYVASEFAKYFSLFIGNGVFGSPTNQLKVVPGDGMNIIVKEGWGFINGYWVHNDSDLIIPIPDNTSSTNRIDSVKLRWTNSGRIINIQLFPGETTNTRTASTYDLQIARITVPYGATSISASNITDTRTNESLCGLVKGLLEVETTEDLFAQYNSLFNEWFDDIKDQLTGDLAVRLQLEFTELNQNVEDYYSNTQTQIDNYHSSTQTQIDSATDLVEDYVNNDYVIQEREFVFVNKVCNISDAKVKATSLLDVYFTADTITHAEDCKITVDSSLGLITLTAEIQPTETIRGMIRVRVN